jgi:hypothetical protein
MIGLLIAPKAAQVREQRKLIEFVEGAGGTVIYEHQFVDHGLSFVAEPNVPTPGSPWVRKLLGDDWFRTPIDIYLRGPRVTDASIRPLMAFRRFRGIVFLEATAVTPKGIAELKQALADATVVPYKI